MINVIIRRNKAGEIVGYTVSGHEADRKTPFIPEGLICNSVSVITQMPVIGMEQCIKGGISRKVVRPGTLEIDLFYATEQTQVLLETMVYSLQSLMRQYPAMAYLDIKTVEVE